MINNMIDILKSLSSANDNGFLDRWSKEISQRISETNFNWIKEVPVILNQILCYLDKLEEEVSQWRQELSKKN